MADSALLPFGGDFRFVSDVLFGLSMSMSMEEDVSAWQGDWRGTLGLAGDLRKEDSALAPS